MIEGGKFIFMDYRKIKNITKAEDFDMGGFPIKQAFPSSRIESLDPFLLLHHAEFKVPEHIPVSQSGVGPHPHRGFSPVTFIYKGGVHHKDSRGNDNVVYEGGIQWINAGMGIIHSERPPEDIFEKGGIQEIIQLWVNTPAAHKMDQPEYIPLTAEDTVCIRSEDGLVRIMIHVGELQGMKSTMRTLLPINIYSIYMSKGGKYNIPVTMDHNAFLYLLDGCLLINEKTIVNENSIVNFNSEGDTITIEALEETRVMIGTGMPLKEPIVSHGPFVMNTQTEIMEAINDYKMGKMGVLIEE